jgi:hypothetical protein
MSTIGKRPSVKSFVAAAPDAKPARKTRGEKPTKVQITLLMPERMLEQVDEVALRRGVSRTALLTFWIGDGLAKEAA